jgi:hypothetical protein
MNEEITKGLRNAGFKEDVDIFRKIGKDFKVAVHLEHANRPTFLVKVYAKLEHSWYKITTNSFTDLPHLSQICFPFNGCQPLDFEAPQYRWEDCVNGGGFLVTGYQDSVTTVEIKSKYERNGQRNVFTTESAAISGGLAHPQLSHIVAKINEDFPERDADGNFCYPVLCKDGCIMEGAYWSRFKVNPFAMNNDQALAKLKETNTPLLLQYFEK